MRTRTIALLAILSAAPAAAQPMQTDIMTLQRTISVLEQQRNNAMNQAALAETRAVQLGEELAKAQARIKELEPKAAESVPPNPKK